MNRLFSLSILSLMLLIPISFAELYISEINFINNEFVEIHSNKTLNLSMKKVFDSKGQEYYNILTPIKIINSSSFYLIIGSNFKSNNDLEALNCNIYQTDKSQVSNGGLKSTGEDLIIQLNNQSNLTYINENSYTFKNNQSLNYNLETDSYQITNISICKPPVFTDNIEQNLTEPSKENTSTTIPNNNTQLSCNPNSFKIITSKNIFEDKIEFKFKTDLKDYEIEYWIETYDGEIVKSKRTTTNSNEKSFTPKPITQVFKILASLNSDNCNLSNEKLITFYSGNSIDKQEIKTEEIKGLILPQKSYIKIENQSNDKIKYEIYRGNTNKYAINIYEDLVKTQTLHLEKYSKIIGILSVKNIKIIKFEGLNITNEFSFKSENDSQVLQNKSSLKQYFNIINFTKNDSKISFQITSNIKNLTSNCYILNKRTKISDIINISNSSIRTLEINESKLFSIQKYNLTLTCKYKKKYLKSYNYEHFQFEHSIKETQSNLNTSEEIISTSSKKSINVYTSKSQQSKTYSKYFVIIGVSILSLIMLVFW